MFAIIKHQQTNLQDEENTELQNLHLWMDEIYLTLNSSKLSVMLINSKLSDKENFENIKTKNSKICVTSTVNYFGIDIDEEINFKYHIARGVGILHNIKIFLPTSPLL